MNSSLLRADEINGSEKTVFHLSTVKSVKKISDRWDFIGGWDEKCWALKFAQSF